MSKNFKQTAVAVLITVILVGMFVWQLSAQQENALEQAVGSTSVQAEYELMGSIGAGGTAVAGNYQTDVMIGQTAVGHSANGDYDLGSGFWGGGIITDVTTLINLFLPLIQH